jgi:hypothetical protein
MGHATSLRRPGLQKKAEAMQQDAARSLIGKVYMHWVDNYNKFRYSRNPNEDRDKCINATVFAVLEVPGADRHQWAGWPSPRQLQARMEEFAKQMHGQHKVFNDDIRKLLRDGLEWDHIRVPCDVRRYGVVTVPWRPLCILDADIKGTPGLVQALREAVQLQHDVMGQACLLMDVNIFWRILKLAYAFHHLPHNVRGIMKECTPVLGVWHAYAHCLKKVYERFLPWWTCLEIPGYLDNPESCAVYTRPRIICIEHLVMGLFLCGPRLEVDLDRVAGQVREAHGTDGPEWEQVRGLQLLVKEYCPALVEMGIAVRQCFWRTQDVGSGDVARLVIRNAIVMLYALHGAGNTEYIRNLVLMDLLWSNLHRELPAACFVEECLESSLSTLTRRLRTDPRAGTLSAFSNTYTHQEVYQPPSTFWDGMGEAYGTGQWGGMMVFVWD